MTRANGRRRERSRLPRAAARIDALPLRADAQRRARRAGDGSGRGYKCAYNCRERLRLFTSPVGVHAPDPTPLAAQSGGNYCGGTPEQFGALVKAETGRWGPLVKRLGLTADCVSRRSTWPLLYRHALPSFRPSPCAMKVRTSVFRETPSVLARVASCACSVLGTRATNLPDATPPPFGAGTGNPLPFNAASVAFSASLPFFSASSTVSPSETHSAKSGYEIRNPPPSSALSGRISNG